MAPVKFGLFKARSRDYQEQPSTENLLHSSSSSDHVSTPSSPVPSTSKAFPGEEESNGFAEFAGLNLDSEDEEVSQETPVRRPSDGHVEETQVNYKTLQSQGSIDITASSTLDQMQNSDDLDSTLNDPIDLEDASTSCDANSIQFDMTSIAASEDLSVYCGTLKKPKKSRSKEEKQLRDFDMWQASNVEVMQNLLSRSGTQNEQYKWEAIATARGLCTLTDTCSCGDCSRAKYLAGVADGDGGLGAAPLFSAINVGCVVQ